MDAAPIRMSSEQASLTTAPPSQTAGEPTHVAESGSVIEGSDSANAAKAPRVHDGDADSLGGLTPRLDSALVADVDQTDEMQRRESIEAAVQSKGSNEEPESSEPTATADVEAGSSLALVEQREPSADLSDGSTISARQSEEEERDGLSAALTRGMQPEPAAVAAPADQAQGAEPGAETPASQAVPQFTAVVEPPRSPSPPAAERVLRSPPLQQYKPTHFRVDSVPPKRYDIEDAAETGARDGPGLNPLSPTIEEEEHSLKREADQFQRYADEHLFYGAGHAMDRIASHMSGVSEASRSGLSFVDVHLEPADDLGSSSMASPSSPFATTFEGKSSEQIRSDNISSASIQPPEDWPSQAAMSRATEGIEAPAAGPSLLRRASQIFSDTPPRSPVFDKALPGRPAEGRYRGRKSFASSRAASPDPHGGSADEPSSSSRSRRSSRYVSPSRAATTTPPRKGHGKMSSVSSTGSSAGAVLSGRITSAIQAEHDRMTNKQLSSLATENLTPAASGITVIVGSDGGDEDVEAIDEPTPTDTSDGRLRPCVEVDAASPVGPEPAPAPEVASGSRPGAQVRSATFKMAAGLDEECQAEGPTSVSQASGGNRVVAANGHRRESHSASSETPSVPTRSTSIQDSLSPSTATITLSPGLSDKADLPQDKQARRRRSSAANADPIESRTRMTTLPPKQKSEEIKHRTDFEKMMVMHKELERKRHEEQEERRLKKEEERRASLVRWEKEILPSWTRARKNEALKALWWQGAPPSIRGRVWALAIGNAMMLPRNLLEQAEKRMAPAGQAAGGSGDGRREISAAVTEAIEEDIAETLPSLKLFQKTTGPLYDDLVRICRAFVLVRMEQVDEMTAAGDADRRAARMQVGSPDPARSPETNGEASTMDEYALRGIQLYHKGLSSLAAILLINLPATTAFICLLNLINSKAWLKALYSLSPTLAAVDTGAAQGGSSLRSRTAELSPKEKGIRGFERVFDTFLADQMPKVYANLLAQNVNIHLDCVRDWVTQLWAAWLDCDTVMRLWDVVLLDETDSLIYRTSLALVQTLESRLYVPDGEELSSVLRGTNRAALSIWRRDKEFSGELPLHVDAAPTSDSTEHLSSPEPSSSDAASLSASVANGPPSKARRPSTVNEVVPKDYIYEQYGIREETIFAVLEKQEWKPSTLSRLLDRELELGD